MAHLVGARLYKPEGRGFDSQWCPSGLTTALGVNSASNKNGIFPGGKGGRCLGLTTLPPSSADCLEIWEIQPPGTLRVCLSL
jgi:hypothetical protein